MAALRIAVNGAYEKFAEGRREAPQPRGSHQEHMAIKGEFNPKQESIPDKKFIHDIAFRMLKETNNVPDAVDLWSVAKEEWMNKDDINEAA